MIPKSTYYSLVHKATHVIVAKGSKRGMRVMMKKNPGNYYIAITSQPVGESFK